MLSWTCAIIILLAWPASPARAEPAVEFTEIVDRTVERLELEQLDDFVRRLETEMREDVPDLRIPSVVESLRQRENPLSLEELAAALARVFWGFASDNMDLLVKLVGLALLAALLVQLQSAWNNTAVAGCARAVVYLGLGAIALSSFRLAYDLACAAVDGLVDAMLALLPVLTALMAGTGAIASAAIFNPLLVVVCDLVAIGVKSWVLPVILISIVLEVVSRFTPDAPLSETASFLRQLGLGLLGVGMLVFLGVITVQGTAGAVTDGVTLRGAKFAAKVFVPVLGSMFSDAAEMVMASSLLLKNAAGLLGLILVLLIAAVPVVKLLCLTLMYRAAGALVYPVVGGEIAGLLGSLSSGLAAVTMAVGAVGIMFYLTLTIVISMGNMAVMLR